MHDRDRELVEALQTGQAGAMDRLYTGYASQVLKWAIRLGGAQVDHEDLAQEVFIIAFRKIGSFRGGSSVSTWLFAITRNVVRNARRRAVVRRIVGLVPETADFASEGPAADEIVAQLQRRRRVQKALDRLKTKQREVIVLCDIEGRTAGEVGQMLSIPPGTVYSRLHHARRAFTKALEAEGFTAASVATGGLVALAGGKKS